MSRRVAAGGWRLAGTLATVLILSGCTELDLLIGELGVFSDMRESVALDPYENPRPPAPGSVPSAGPMGPLPAPFSQQELEEAAATLENPLPATPPVLARGEFVFGTHCSVCHGADGGGEGPVSGPGKFPVVPPVNGAETAARSDGYLYGVVRVGRALMPPYGERLSETDRWAVVNYLRRLQAEGGPAASDQ
ncbi:MAG: c-type cytochrome [Longimicrobiaceae bacterium]